MWVQIPLPLLTKTNQQGNVPQDMVKMEIKDGEMQVDATDTRNLRRLCKAIAYVALILGIVGANYNYIIALLFYYLKRNL